MKKVEIILMLFVLLGCDNKYSNKKNDKLINLNPLNNTSLVTDFNSYIDTVLFIPFETKQESFIVDISKILLTTSQDIVVLNSTNILLFNAQGKFKFKIGKNGKGPGEYIRIIDICISNDKSTLFALDCYNHVLKYSLTDGNYIGSIKPRWKGKESTFDGISTSKDGGFFLFSSNPQVIDDFKSSFFCLGKFDSVGNLLNESFPRKDFCFSPDRFSYSFDHSTLLRPLEGEKTLYRIVNGEIKPVLNLDFGEYSIPLKYIYDFPGNAWLNIPKYIKSPYYKLPMGFFETKTDLYFWCGGPNGETHEFVFSTNKHKGIHWKCRDKFPFTFIASDSTYFYAMYNDIDDVNEANENINPLKRYLKKHNGLKKDIEESNPILVKISFSNLNN